MKVRSVAWFLWVPALLALAVGLAMSARSMGLLRETGERWRRKRLDIEAMASLARSVEQYAAARQAFEQLETPTPPALEKIMADSLGDRRPDEARDNRRDAVEGWTVRRRELSFKEVPLADLVTFAATAEAQRPPWCLVQIVIRSSRQGVGPAQTQLAFEALERSRR